MIVALRGELLGTRRVLVMDYLKGAPDARPESMRAGIDPRPEARLFGRKLVRTLEAFGISSPPRRVSQSFSHSVSQSVSQSVSRDRREAPLIPFAVFLNPFIIIFCWLVNNMSSLLLQSWLIFFFLL